MNDAGFVLRALGARDLDRAARLHGAAFAALGEPGWTRQDVAELLASPGVAGLLLEADGGPRRRHGAPFVCSPEERTVPSARTATLTSFSP